MIFELFISGLVLSYLGSLPIGVLNSQALLICARYGWRAAWWFAIGVIAVEYLQAMVAIAGVSVIRSYPWIMLVLKVIGVLVFGYLGILNLKKRNGISLLVGENEQNFGQQGLRLSALNFFAVPYWVVIITSLTIPVQEVFSIDSQLFIWGVIVGTLGALMTYALAGKAFRAWFEVKSRWIQLVMGLLFLLVGVWQSIILVQEITELIA